MVARIYHRTGGKLPIIGVGGVMSGKDAREKLDAGASLVQLYTGLVYRGPGLVKEILKDI
jgi:dihydroorotate dehydrogenase